MPHSILIVDDSESVRRLVRSLIEQNREWQVCGEAENGKEAVKKVQELRPDIVILDFQMPVMNGLEAAWQIAHLAPNTAMVMFTMHDDGELRNQAHAAGIHDVVCKGDQSAQYLMVSLRNVLGSTPLRPA